MKNGLGALDRALDTLKTYATEDEIPINDPAFVETIVEDGKRALDDVRALVQAVNALSEVAPLNIGNTAPAWDHVQEALTNLVTAREGAHVS